MDKPHNEMTELEYLVARLDMVTHKITKIEELFALLFTDIIEMKTITATMLEFMEIDGEEYKAKYALIYNHLLKRSQERVTKFYDQGSLSAEHETQLLMHNQFSPMFRVLA